MAAVTAPAVPKAAVETRVSRGLWRDAWSRLLRNKPAIVGMVIIAIFVFVAVLAPVLAPYDPLEGVLQRKPIAPGPEHLLGTDIQGRDMLTRILYGARVSLIAAIASVVMGLAIGGTIGALAGGIGGKVDTVLMRITDVFLAIPGILLAIGIVAWLDRGLPQIMFAVAVVNAPIFARILRGSLLSLRESDYVMASRSVGASSGRLLMRHLLPNSLTPLIVACTLAMATAIIDVAGLGFLGLGPPDPRTPEWGTMLTDAVKFFRQGPWLLFFPGAAIVITAVGFNLLGDGLRESLDPRMKR